jgi:hypothetical protein
MTMHSYQRDYPVTPPMVTIPCPHCLQPAIMEYDPGESGSYWEPGCPAGWVTDHPCGSDGTGLWDRMQAIAEYSPEYQQYQYEESCV